jgi:DNA-binding NarL/FixJ family response regulator
VLAVVVYEQALLRRLLRALDSTGVEVGAVLRPGQGLAAISDLQADVVAYACDPNGAKEATRVRALRDGMPGVAVLLIVPAGLDGARLVRRALSIGADGVVVERDLERTLPSTVLALAAGQLVVPRTSRRSLQRPQLTYREKQVLALAVSGQTNAQIGARLYLAESTVKSHLSSAFRQLGVASRREAAALVLDPSEELGLHVLGPSNGESSSHSNGPHSGVMPGGPGPTPLPGGPRPAPAPGFRPRDEDLGPDFTRFAR